MSRVSRHMVRQPPQDSVRINESEVGDSGKTWGNSFLERMGENDVLTKYYILCSSDKNGHAQSSSTASTSCRYDDNLDPT